MHRFLVPLVLALFFSGAAFAADDDISKINGSVQIASGEHAGNVNTVNGSVHVASGAQVQKASTVNGDVEIGDNAAAREVQTVNGGITVGSKGHIASTIEAVNGSIQLAQGAEVAGHLSNVNGSINLDAAHVAGGLETTAGDITVGANSRVEGGIVVNEPHGSWFNSDHRVPHIVIGPGAVVQGTLEFDREVELHISNRATVGPIKGATAIRFSGATP